MPPYNPNIPQPGDQLSASQPQILANFQALAPVVGGIFANQGADPLTGPTDLALYNKTVGAAQQLFIRLQNNGNIYSITAHDFAAGYTMLASGLCIKFGGGTVPGGAGSAVNVNYNVTFPFTAAPYVALTPFVIGGPGPATWSPLLIRITGVVNDLLSLRVTRGPTVDTSAIQFTYIAIGPTF